MPNPKGKHLMNGKETNKGKSFKKGVSGNPKGRPRKTISSILHQMDKDGIVKPTGSEMLELIARIQNMLAHELKAYVDDPEMPMVCRLYAKELLGKNGFGAVNLSLDRVYGRPTQKVEHDATLDVQVVLSRQETIYLQQAFTEDEDPKV